MQNNYISPRLKNFIYALAGSFFVIVFTFPPNDLTFTPGIDPPLAYLFNDLFENGLSKGQGIIFPHGPLAFFLYPLQENILLANVVKAMLKALIFLSNLFLLKDYGKMKWVLALLFALTASLISGFTHLILINILLLFLNFYDSEKPLFKYAAFFLVAFGFYVKSYVAIISGIICFSFLTYQFITTLRLKSLLIDMLLQAGLIILFWLLMYGNIEGFAGYLKGLTELARDNSSAAAYYPENNWFFLSSFLLILFTIPLINRSRRSIFFISISGLSLFAAWKHGMAREDIFHLLGFWSYVLLILFLYNLFIIRYRLINLVLSMAAVTILTIHLDTAQNYEPVKFSLNGPSNFASFIFKLDEIKSEAQTQNQLNTEAKRLSSKVIEKIGNQTTDIYPWDYSIVYANDLNWKPRVVIQSYAAYTSWLDKQNADHFNSSEAPEYIIWELDRQFGEGPSKGLNSIDNRYLLNDEPKTIIEILRNYEPVDRDGDFLILKRRKEVIGLQDQSVFSGTATWGKWLKVPDNPDDILRLKVEFGTSFLRKLKSFFYKDEQFWIYLKLTNGQIHKYRIVPRNAADGLWIAPYISDAGSETVDPAVSEIMFKVSGQTLLPEEITLTWEAIDFNDPEFDVQEYFGQTKEEHSKEILSQTLSIDNPENTACKKGAIHFSSEYSPALKINLDSISVGEIEILAESWVKTDPDHFSKELQLVISVDNEEGNISWKGFPVYYQQLDRNEWDLISGNITLDHSGRGNTLSVYFLNPDGSSVCFNQLRATVMEN